MNRVKNGLTKFVDWFYIKPFERLVPLQIFRYMVCGGINFALTMICYAAAYNWVFDGLSPLDMEAMGWDLPPFLAPEGFLDLRHYAALAISLPVNALTGFWLQKNISFRSSPLPGHVQFFRYLSTAIGALVLTLGFTFLFVDVCGIWPTPAQAIIYCITAVFSFVMQKYFTFRGATND